MQVELLPFLLEDSKCSRQDCIYNNREVCFATKEVIRMALKQLKESTTVGILNEDELVLNRYERFECDNYEAKMGE